VSFIKNHIVLNVFAAILTISIVIPSAVKFAHAFENHQHEVCTNFSTTHLHQLDIDCEFYKFKIPIQTFENTKKCIVESLLDLSGLSPIELREKRIDKYRNLGFFQRFNYDNLGGVKR